MRSRVHTHPCRYAHIGCRTVIDCDGELEQNYDGWPEVVCPLYHRLGMARHWICAACEASLCSACGCVARLEYHDPDCECHTEKRAG